jgi:hypothetical protein
MPRNEPSNFERLHGHMRNLKQELGIDMLHPNGVSIHGKTYPAYNKSIEFSTTNSKESGMVSLNIPLENGHRLFMFGHGLHHPEGVLNASFEVNYPHKWTDLNPGPWNGERTEGYSYYPKDTGILTPTNDEEMFKTDNLNPKSPKEFSDFIQRVSSVPTKGYKRSWSYSKDSKQMRDNPNEMMNKDDFSEFHKYKHLGHSLGSKNANPPHMVYTIIHGATPNYDYKIARHSYDIKTEQLRKQE